MAHEVETMAYANEVPWHGLGARVDGGISVDDMRKAAGLDWELKRAPMHATLEDGTDVPVTDRVAWVRNTDSKVLVVSGKLWRPFQPSETLEFMRNYVASGNATLETAGSLRGGRVVWGLARLHHDFEVGRGDRVNGYLLFTSPNEVGKAITVRTTTVRVVCANTLAMAEYGGGAHYTQNHLKDFNVETAKDAVGKAHEQLAQAERNAKTLAALKINVPDAIAKVLLPVFCPEIAADEEATAAIAASPENRPKRLNEILASVEDAPGNKEIAGTGWAILNGVTHWADHSYGNTQASRLWRSWYGDNGRHKLETEKRLLELAD